MLRLRRRVPFVRSAILPALLLAPIQVLPALAAAGDLDTSFSGDGKTTINFTAGDDPGWSTAVDASDRIVVAGHASGLGSRFALARFNEDGTLDTTFGDDGRVMTNFTPRYDGAWGVAIQADGKIVAAGDSGLGSGNSGFAVARYNENGTLDTSFNGDGKITIQFTTRDDPVAGLALAADGKIVVSGGSAVGGANPRFAVARLDTNGALDPTFSGDGRVMTDLKATGSNYDYANAVVVQADGKIVAGGFSAQRFALVRYHGDGTLDTTFGGDGKVRTDVTRYQDTITGLAVQSDGAIVAAGIAGVDGPNPGFALARYEEALGALDTTFSGDGKLITQFTSGWDGANGVTVQDGSIVAVGAASGSGGRFALASYLANGQLDTTFGGDGKVTTNFTPREEYARGVDTDASGNIVVAGFAGWGRTEHPVMAVARYQGS
jgi:uncharacterized delta-60 repeat protein